MFDFVFHLPDTYVFALLSVITILISIAAISVVRSHVSLEKRYKDNTGIANTSALISIIYGVLAGLMALYLINNISYTTDAVRREANAAADLYRDSKWLTEPARANIQIEIKKYIDRVVTIEWPLLKDGKELHKEGEAIIDEISRHLSEYKIANNSELVIVRDMLEVIRHLYDAREQRIQMSFAQLSPETWIVILIGSILTISINFLLGMNFYLHALTVTSVALMTSGMIFLLITLDRPFQGEFVVGPDALVAVQSYIEKYDKAIVQPSPS